MKRIKLILLLIPILLLAGTAEMFSQLRIGIKGAAALPTGYFEDAVSVGIGSNINFSHSIIYSNFEISLSTGYYYFGLKEDLPDYDFTYKTIPILIGARFNFTDYNFIPYIGVEAGIYLTEYFLNIDYGYFGSISKITKDAHWGIAPEIGFRMNLSPYVDLDVNAKYNRINTKYIARAFLLVQSGFSFRF